MSFFFSDLKRAPKEPQRGPAGPRKGNVSAKHKQAIPSLNRLGCKACPLKEVGERVNAKIPKRSDVFILSEAPGSKDESKGYPLFGKAGKLVKDMVPDEFEKRVAYGTVVQHRPPKDRDPDFVEIECCRKYVEKAIEEAKPKLIIGMGIISCKWALGSADISGMRGRIFTVKIGEHVCYFMPVFSPNFVLRNAYDPDKPLQSRMGHAFRMDFRKAFDFVADCDEPVYVSKNDVRKNVTIYSGERADKNGFESLLAALKEARKAKAKALDYETYPIRPYHKDAVLLTASLAYRHEGELKTFAFAVDHPKAQWTKRERRLIVEEFEKVLADKKKIKIAHNAPFEIEWSIFLCGLDFVDHNSWEDTMMQAHLLDERKGEGREEDRRPTYQSLNFLCKQHFGLDLKSHFKLDKKDMRKSDITECLIYNGADSKYTLLLYERQKRLLKEEGLLKLFNFIKPRQTSVALMQHLGIPIDQKRVKSYQKKLKRQIEKITAKIMKLKVVKRYIADKGEFNPMSNNDVLAIYRDYLKADAIKVEQKAHKQFNYDISSASKKKAREENVKFKYSVDKAALDQVDHPLSQLILTLRNRQKLKSTYVDEFILGEGSLIYPDGNLHTNFNTTFTTSGRLSSDDPNLQNFPKREDKWVRGQLRVPEGYVLVSIDYGQLEWCLACICTEDQVMVDATWKGYDVHMVWAKKIAKRWPKLVGGKKYLDDKVKMKKARGLVKNKMVFPAIFGAQESSIGGYLNMPEDVTKDIFNEFWTTFTGLASWHKSTMKTYYNDGFVTNLFGRKRRYPMTKNEAINFPIQSTAAEMVCNAMDRLSMLAVKTGQWHMHPRLNIHDDLTFILPDDETLDGNIETIIAEMLRLKYKFVNVPMSVELSIGDDWNNQDEIAKYWTTGKVEINDG